MRIRILKKPAIILVVISFLIGFGLWQLRSRQKSASNPESIALEELQALPYVQWTKNKETQKQGVKTYDARRAWHGYNVYTNDVDKAYLMDMAGKHLHSWRFRNRKKCEYVHLLANGEMLAVCMGQGIWKVDWNSNLIWINRMFVHHDLEPVPDGTFWTIRREKNREYQGRLVVFDALQRIAADGQLLEKWYTFDHLDELKRWHKPLPLDTVAKTKSDKRKYDYYHLNTVKLLPENVSGKSDRRFRKGNLLICLRNSSLIAILDQDTMKIVWGYGPDELDWPHMPVMLPNGNILVFDNGIHRRFSRVLEINPLTRQIVWSYGGENQGFYSALQGSAQRLENGNTLICESDRGHVFEVNREKKVVWEYWNPEMKGENRKTIYRFIRVPIGSVPTELLTKTSTGKP